MRNEDSVRRAPSCSSLSSATGGDEARHVAKTVSGGAVRAPDWLDWKVLWKYCCLADSRRSVYDDGIPAGQWALALPPVFQETRELNQPRKRKVA